MANPEFSPEFRNIVSSNTQKDAIMSLADGYVSMLGQDPKQLFANINDPNFWESQYLDPTGEAWGMSTMDAIRCLVDMPRTIPLINAINETVNHLKEQGKTNITAIDAGTGTGVLSIALATSGCAQVKSLEINHDSAEATREFVDKLGLSDTIEVIECDATKIDLGDLKADILVSENLSNGLFDEPQYQIIHHLSQFLSPSAEILPAKSELFVALANTNWQGLDGNRRTAWKLPYYHKLTESKQYADVVSEQGVLIADVRGQAEFVLPEGSEMANGLMVSSRFLLNKSGIPQYLEPDTASFLGRSTVFKLQDGVMSGERVVVDLQYTTGMSKDYVNVRRSGNVIKLGDGRN